MGNKVVVLSSNADKKDKATAFGADEFCLITDAEGRKAHAGKCNIILDTRSVEHQIKDNFDLCANSGTIVELGLLLHDHKVNHMALFPQRKSITGSWYGNVQNIEKMLADADKLAPETVVVTPEQLDTVMKSLADGNKDSVKYVLSLQ